MLKYAVQLPESRYTAPVIAIIQEGKQPKVDERFVDPMP